MQLRLTHFGNPILRSSAQTLTPVQIRSEEIQTLIKDMYEYLDARPHFGVGIAAPQLGAPLAISVISIKPTPYRPVADHVRKTIINPEVIETYGKSQGMWEGCISFGTSTTNFPYAQTRRYRKIRLRYHDEHGTKHEEDFEGLLAHVMQHETDHLHGILFVDRVTDTSTYMMKTEYVKRYLKGKK